MNSTAKRDHRPRRAGDGLPQQQRPPRPPHRWPAAEACRLVVGAGAQACSGLASLAPPWPRRRLGVSHRGRCDPFLARPRWVFGASGAGAVDRTSSRREASSARRLEPPPAHGMAPGSAMSSGGAAVVAAAAAATIYDARRADT